MVGLTTAQVIYFLIKSKILLASCGSRKAGQLVIFKNVGRRLDYSFCLAQLFAIAEPVTQFLKRYSPS